MQLTSDKIILIVEDSPEDYEATLRAFKRPNLINPLYHCVDGLEALDFLQHKNAYQDKAKYPRPHVILLDLNLPKMDGREVLRRIKEDPELKSIPVIVMTTSNDDLDIQKCYDIGANSYIHKPVDLQKFIEAIQKMVDYWFGIVVFPKETSFPGR